MGLANYNFGNVDDASQSPMYCILTHPEGLQRIEHFVELLLLSSPECDICLGIPLLDQEPFPHDLAEEHILTARN